MGQIVSEVGQASYGGGLSLKCREWGILLLRYSRVMKL